MKKLSDLITVLRRELNSVPAQNAAALTVLGFEVQNKVQDMIGTKQLFWKDLAESTIEQKRHHHLGKGGDPASPLWASGEYHDSIQYKVTQYNSVEIFTDLDFVKYLEMGTAKMAPRPVFKPAAKLVLREFVRKNKLSNFYLRGLR